ncbi:optineurin [Menidia menidia]
MGGVRAQLGALRLQVSRLQAEKSDLLALNSELQLRAEQDHSFIQVIQVTAAGRVSVRSAGRRGGGGELTVSQLLQSLRNETQQRERLQDRIRELEDRRAGLDQATQTAESQEEGGGEEKASEVEDLKGQMRTLFQELQQAQRRLDEAEAMKKNLQDRVRDLEQDLNALRAGQAENERLKLQLDSQQAQSLVEQRRAEDERNNLAQLKDAYTKLFEDYSELKEDGRKREAEGGGLQQRLAAAEEALASKQTRIDELKQEMVQKEKELETISVFQAQAEVYSSDFYAERAAREKLHEEKERLAARLDYVQKQNSQLQEELDSLGRSSLTHMQKRHLAAGGGPLGAGAALVGRGPDWQRRGDLPEHVCPKCSETLPDLDSLQIHIMDCIN